MLYGMTEEMRRKRNERGNYQNDDNDRFAYISIKRGRNENQYVLKKFNWKKVFVKSKENLIIEKMKKYGISVI